MAKHRNYTSAYNEAESEASEDPKEKIRCVAHGCPLAGSRNDGGDGWTCSYHAMAGGSNQWPFVTKVINENAHYQRMLKAVNKLRAHEFDELQRLNSWAVHKLIMPVAEESHCHWQGRVRATIHRALQHKVHEALEDQANRFSSGGRNVSQAVKELTSGVLIQKVKKSA
ncbi:hypothetical protein A3765_28605 [Oleiphilus sp. HI0130]|nr:hypothetical protein A3765_28890 [Oleiphilus sp. HI0130]KZZ72514.1 hypothetical protein A3765_28605 [Oleiphilus sp. HI0130]